MSSHVGNLYAYNPSLALGGLFLALFGLLTLAHVGIVVKSRHWWMSVTVVGGAAEIIGWIGRTLSHNNVGEKNPFLIQQVCLIMGPCFFSAALYGSLGLLISQVGPQHSRLRPTLYVYTFVSADLAAIIVQAVGGAKASSGIDKSRSTADMGANIMLGGIVLQLVSMLVFCALGLDFWRTSRKDTSYVAPRDSRLGLFSRSIAAASILILIRCIYRTVELSEGWTGYLVSHEVFFIVFDAIMMTLCMVALLFGHPYFGLPARSSSSQTQAKLESNTTSTDTLTREKNLNSV